MKFLKSLMSVASGLLGSKPIPNTHESVGLPDWLAKQDLQFIEKNNNRYPPRAEGLPIVRPDLMIEDQKQLIHSIAIDLTIPPHKFDQFVMPVIQTVAKYQQLLPASRIHHHRLPGGLFRHSLEVGHFAAKAARETNFATIKDPSDRLSFKSRMIVASFFAGLLHDIGKPFTDVSITDIKSEHKWDPLTTSLYDFAIETNSPRIFYSWVNSRHRSHNAHAITTLAFDRVVPSEVKAFLGNDVYKMLFDSVNGHDTTGLLTTIMLKADGLSNKRDLLEQNITEQPYSADIPINRYIVDALRKFALRETVNCSGSKIWVTQSGVFLMWTSVFAEIRKILDDDCRQAIPRTPEEVASLMIDWGDAVTTNCKSHPYYTMIYPTVLNGSGLQVLQLSNKNILFPYSDVPTTSISFDPPPKVPVQLSPDQDIEQIFHNNPVNDVDIEPPFKSAVTTSSLDQPLHDSEISTSQILPEPKNSSYVTPISTSQKKSNAFSLIPKPKKAPRPEAVQAPLIPVDQPDNHLDQLQDYDNYASNQELSEIDVLEKSIDLDMSLGWKVAEIIVENDKSDIQDKAKSLYLVEGQYGVLYPDFFDSYQLSPTKALDSLISEKKASGTKEIQGSVFVIFSESFFYQLKFQPKNAKEFNSIISGDQNPELIITEFVNHNKDKFQFINKEGYPPNLVALRSKHLDDLESVCPGIIQYCIDRKLIYKIGASHFLSGVL